MGFDRQAERKTSAHALVIARRRTFRPGALSTTPHLLLRSSLRFAKKSRNERPMRPGARLRAAVSDHRAQKGSPTYATSASCSIRLGYRPSFRASLPDRKAARRLAMYTGADDMHTTKLLLGACTNRTPGLPWKRLRLISPHSPLNLETCLFPGFARRVFPSLPSPQSAKARQCHILRFSESSPSSFNVPHLALSHTLRGRRALRPAFQIKHVPETFQAPPDRSPGFTSGTCVDAGLRLTRCLPQ